jgi:hypothetical protein
MKDKDFELKIARLYTKISVERFKERFRREMQGPLWTWNSKERSTKPFLEDMFSEVDPPAYPLEFLQSKGRFTRVFRASGAPIEYKEQVEKLSGYYNVPLMEVCPDCQKYFYPNEFMAHLENCKK